MPLPSCQYDIAVTEVTEFMYKANYSGDTTIATPRELKQEACDVMQQKLNDMGISQEHFSPTGFRPKGTER